jgi:molybdenum cofactor biosynthesis enzyme MoaA
MTGTMPMRAEPVNWRNFMIAVKFAEISGVTTMLLTSKGEPTIWPELITDYLHMNSSVIPIVELQTNGLRIQQMRDEFEMWYGRGLTTVALSVVHYDDERNAEIYTPGKEYPSLTKTISILKAIGFSVRLTVMLVRGYITTPMDVVSMLEFARYNNVDQLTIRPIEYPSETENLEIKEYTLTNTLSRKEYKDIVRFLDGNATHLLTLSHGAKVYDYKGQNVCASNCLTVHPGQADTIRQIIFFPNGSIKYAWQHNGATLL